MAEFDTSGFSAIDDFFGKDSAPNDSEPPSSQVSSKSLKGKVRRQGVGSSKSRADTDILAKRILTVGKKRRRGDIDDEDVGSDAGKDDVDDEEDVGRTGITPQEKSLQQDSVPPKEVAPKKKLGKKERKRLMEEGNLAAPITEAPQLAKRKEDR